MTKYIIKLMCNLIELMPMFTLYFGMKRISAENRFQNKDRLISQFNDQSSINSDVI